MSSVGPHYRAAPSFAELGGRFFDLVEPARFPEHVLRYRNDRWAARVGLASLSDAAWEDHFARFVPLPDNIPQPMALRYHGHQFHTYNPNLGDGRGFLFAQLRDGCDGRLLDLGTKGSGTTPYSRGGDGRLTLKGGYREVLATEMLEALGVNTSKSFSLYETGEKLVRYDEPSPTRSCVLVRLGHAHIRIGTFQRLEYMRNTSGLYELLSHCIRHYYPAIIDAQHAPAAFVAAVARACARTCAEWMAAGFVHGVLNTDNINITGESFDYGPYRFLPHLDAAFTAAYFDHSGLYAYGRQPATMRWNLDKLAAALGAIGSHELLQAAAASFDARFAVELPRKILNRLGLASLDPLRDSEVARCCLALLDDSRVSYDGFFFDWYGGEVSRSRALAGPRANQYRGAVFDELRRSWEEHAPRDVKRLEHAYFGRDEPCTVVIDEIESIWSDIATADDWRGFEQKLHDIRELAQAHGRAMTPPRVG